MQSIVANYNKLSREEINRFKAQGPKSIHVSKMIDEECMLYVDNRLVAIYKKANFMKSDLLETCCRLKFETYMRTNGMLTTTVNINAVPRNPLRDNICKLAGLSYNFPNQHNVFLDYGKAIAHSYKKYFSYQYAQQVKQSVVGKMKIDKNYIIKGSPFTSAVVNKNCSMGYHFDQANTKDGLSCMIILKENVAGGELILPELNIGFACQDEFILLFDGQKYMHGVTDMVKATGGYRYTIVYYNNSGMRLCLPPDEELKHSQSWLERNEKF